MALGGLDFYVAATDATSVFLPLLAVGVHRMGESW